MATRPRELRLARRGLVERVRLALERGAAVEIVAGAGFGKTTLLQQALEELAAPTAWLSCSASDRDPQHLLVRLVSAIASAVPGASDELRDRLSAAVPVDPVAVVRDLLDDLGSVLVDPVVVVIDDAEHLVGELASLAIVSALLRPNDVLRSALASRRPLDVASSKLRLDGHIESFGASDLALDTRECAAMLELATDSTPSVDDVNTLMASTEGWPLAVAAMALRAREQREGTSGGLLGRGAPSAAHLRSTAEVRAFLAEEVLSSVEADLRRQIIQSSVPRFLTPSISAGLGLADDFLDRVRSNGLFLRALDDRPDAVAYHPLFRECLLEQLAAEEPEGERRALHHRVARAMAAEGSTVDAAEHLAAAGDWGELAELLAAQGSELLVTSPRLVGGWLARLPAGHRSRPAMQVLAGRLAWGTGRFDEAIRSLQAAVDHWDAPDGRSEWPVRYALMQALFVGGRADQAIEVGIDATAPGPPDDAMAAAAGMFAAHCLAALGQADRSESAAARARSLGPDDLLHPLDALRRVYLDLPAGQVERALANASQALESIEKADPLLVRPSLRTSIAFMLAEQGDVEDALTSWRRIESEAQEHLLSFAVRPARAAQALLLAQVGRTSAAEATLATVDDVGWGWTGYLPEVARAVVAAGRGDRSGVIYAAARAGDAARQAPPAFRILAACDLVPPLVRVGASDRTRELLADAAQLVSDTYPGDAGRLLSRRLGALRAWVAAAEGDGAASDAALVGVFAQPGEAERSVVRREWERLEPLVWSALERGILDAEVVSTLLVSAFPDGLALVPYVDHPDPVVRRWALAPAWASGHPDGAIRVVQRCADPDPEVTAAATALTDGRAVPAPPRAFTLLGGFQVRRGAWSLDEPTWGRPIAARVVRYLLVADAPVPDDELVEAFWPTLNPDGARRSLHVAASRVRAALDHPGAHASVLEARDGTYRLRLDELDVVDAVEFERAAIHALGGGSGRAGLERAVSLWGGEPLPEERYAAWTTSWRARLVDRYAAVLAALVDRCHADGDLAGATAAARQLVTLDEFNEAAHRALMVAYARSGRRAAALRQYLECRHRLVAELGIEPAAETSRLQARIVAGEPV